MNDHAKAILKSVTVLTLIGALVTAALAGTNMLTAGTIAAALAAENEKACAQVISAESFSEKTLSTEDGDVTYYEAAIGDEVAGYVFTVTTKGKSAGLVVMTGVSADGSVTGVQITDNNETAGYVDKVTKGGLLDRVKGKDAGSVKDVDTVSNATKTSKGVLSGVEQALTLYHALKGGAV